MKRAILLFLCAPGFLFVGVPVLALWTLGASVAWLLRPAVDRMCDFADWMEDA